MMIRPYEDADLAEVIEAWYRSSLVAHPFLDAEFFERERELIAEQWLPAAETSVVIDDGRVAGFVAMVDHEVGGLFVHPDHHRRGHGRALLDHARSTRSFLELEVFEANTLGRAFYAAYGFVEIGTLVDERTGQPALRLRVD